MKRLTISYASFFKLLMTAYPRIHSKIYLLYRLRHLSLCFTFTHFVLQITNDCVHLCKVLYIRGIVKVGGPLINFKINSFKSGRVFCNCSGKNRMLKYLAPCV